MLRFTFDATANKLYLGMRDGSAPGYSSTYAYTTTSITAMATLPNSVFTTQTAFSFNMVLDCCAPPTVISAPTPASGYTYTIGKTAENILLGPWVGNNACCSLSPQTVTIDTDPPGGAAAPAGLFTVAADKKSVTVYTTDASATGPGGNKYTVTTSTYS